MNYRKSLNNCEKKNLKEVKGITLIALVITIIVLLILAGVSIGTLFDTDGLFGKANAAATKWNQSKENELEYLKNIINDIDIYNEINGGEQPNEKEEGILRLSETSGVIQYPQTCEFKIVEHTSDGKLRVSSSDDSIATASITENTITINSQAVTSSGRQAVITVTSEETENYEEKTATYTITVNQGTISISATGYSGIEDGNSHPTVSGVSTDPNGCTLQYKIDTGTYSSSIPTVSATGNYTITIKASKTRIQNSGEVIQSICFYS